MATVTQDDDAELQMQLHQIRSQVSNVNASEHGKEKPKSHVTHVTTSEIQKEKPKLMNEPEEPVEPPKRKVKKPKLTKAEKKERKLKAAMEFRRLEMRDHLRRELELSKRMYEKGRSGWEDMCKEIKLTELREELEAFNANTDRIFKQKDEMIESLINDIEEADEMNKRTYGFQLQIIDYFIGVYKELIESQKVLYEADASEMIQEFKEELAEKEVQYQHHQTNSENIMHASNLIVEEQLQNDYKNFLCQRDERVNANIVLRYNHRDTIVEKMQLLQKQLVEFVESLKASNLDPHKYERINALMARQRHFVIASKKLNDLEFRSIRVHGDLQRECIRLEVESQRRINDLRLEHAYFVQVRKLIEKEMNMDRDITFEKLKVLTSSSYTVNKELEEYEKHGELLLALAASCRKLQTESEKVVFGGKDVVSNAESIEDQELFKLRTLDLKAHIDLSEEELIEQMNCMKHFWRRQAIVESENVLLEREKHRLTVENQKHIDFIKSLGKTDNTNELEATLICTQCNIPTESLPCLKR